MRVRLTRKLADCLDGVDLSRYAVGDVLDLPKWEAHLLIAEGWAVLSEGAAHELRPCIPTDEELRCIREQLTSWSEQPERRRAEDRIREVFRDSRAVIVRARNKPPAENRKRKS